MFAILKSLKLNFDINIPRRLKTTMETIKTRSVVKCVIAKGNFDLTKPSQCVYEAKIDEFIFQKTPNYVQ